jgi:hypothetical protein
LLELEQHETIGPATIPPGVPDYAYTPSNMAFMWGWNASASVPSNYMTGGQEELYMLDTGKRNTYNYAGQGNAWGEGASVSAPYVGVVFNIKDASDYEENFASAGFTVSIADLGVTASYFWSPSEGPLTPGNVQGFAVGYAPGAQLSLWSAVTYYNKTWSSK